MDSAPTHSTSFASRSAPDRLASKRLAFGGIELHLPSAWEIALLDTDFLRLDTGGARPRAALDIKWNRVQGRFHMAKHLRRIRKLYGEGFRELDTPGQWQDALPDHQMAAFGHGMRGRGVVLYNPASSMAAVLLFHLPHRELDDDWSEAMHQQAEREALDVLTSFRDRFDGPIPYALYDLQAQVPPRYKLTKASFKAGMYDLGFAAPGEALRLVRVAPARMRMGNEDVNAWAQSTFDKELAHARVQSDASNTYNRCALTGRPPLGPAGWLVCRLFGRRAHHTVHARHDQAGDKLYGISHSGLRPGRTAELKTLAETFGTRGGNDVAL